jgi:phospholipid-binding lipoprotein MlaA
MRSLKLKLLWVVVLLTSGCTAVLEKRPVQDPWEGVNRKIFWFNDKLDVYALEPVAQAYVDYVPEPVQTGTHNFLSHWRYPQRLVSSLVQGKMSDVAEQTGRFVVNSTLGLLGLFDPATDMGMEPLETDFGVALGTHGVVEGPYVVLPFMGPSNVRDTVGKVVDYALDPLNVLDFVHSDDAWKSPTLSAVRVVDIVDTRAGLLEAIKTGKESSVDFYLFSQGAYHQYRQGLISGKETDADPFAEEKLEE